MSRDPFSERFQCGDILTGCHHLSDKQEANRGGQHVGCDACKIIDIKLHFTTQTISIESAISPVYSDAYCNSQQSNLKIKQIVTVA